MILKDIILETEQEIQDMKEKMASNDAFVMFGKEYVVIELSVHYPDIRQSTCTLRSVFRKS